MLGEPNLEELMRLHLKTQEQYGTAPFAYLPNEDKMKTNKEGHGSCTRQTGRNIFCFVAFFVLIPNLKTVYPPWPPVLSYRRSN